MARHTRKYDPQQIYNFIVKFKEENDGNSPTHRDIMEAIGISSLSVAHYHIQKLVEQGLITTDEQGQISVIGGKWVLTTATL
jgi:SOS-response transcriptional repressor LexA